MCVTFTVDCNRIYKEKVAGISVKTYTAYLTTREECFLVWHFWSHNVFKSTFSSILSTDLDNR